MGKGSRGCEILPKLTKGDEKPEERHHIHTPALSESASSIVGESPCESKLSLTLICSHLTGVMFSRAGLTLPQDLKQIPPTRNRQASFPPSVLSNEATIPVGTRNSPINTTNRRSLLHIFPVPEAVDAEDIKVLEPWGIKLAEHHENCSRLLGHIYC